MTQHSLGVRLRRHWQMYLFALLPLIYLIIFKYVPMLGVQIAFKRYNARMGIWGSPWVGLMQFTKFFNSYQFERVLTNTIVLSLYSLVAGFPLPIVLALMMNAERSGRMRSFVQNVTYMPHFISTVVMVGILNQFFNTRYGGFANIWHLFSDGKVPDLLSSATAFTHMYVWSGVWQGMGWGSIIYMAAIAGIAPSLYEAAKIDGASRIQQIWHITLPGLKDIISIQLILCIGGLFGSSFDQIFNMRNATVKMAAQTLDTYIYDISFGSVPNYGFSTATGLFCSVVSFILLTIGNKLVYKLTGTKLIGKA